MNNIVEGVLVKYLGKYIDGLKNSLDIGVLDGTVTIENVSLKTSFVNELGLPFTLKFSHIEKIHINIPWTKLKEKSTQVSVKGIYVLLNISYQESEEQVDPAELLKGMVERIRAQMKKKWTEGGKEETFAEKNLIRIVDNAVVQINNIHIRLESYHRNWDYSFGVIMDGISSYTVDEDERKTLYTRHFSHKEKNLPFKKLLNIQKLQLYFNDTEDVFLTNLTHKPQSFLIRMMAHPFPIRVVTSPKKPAKQEEEPYPPYSLKNLTTIQLSAVGSQRFAADMRYVVEVAVTINSIDIRLGSKQLSQLFHCVQHFYDYGLNILKNGRKGYDFGEERQKSYRQLVGKLAREEKLSAGEHSQLLGVLAQVPFSLLESINDEVANDVRFNKEIKKIAEVRNAQKSKKMMQDLIDMKEKLQAMEGVDIFKEVVIDCKVHRINLGLCDISGAVLAEFGFIGVTLSVDMDLAGEIAIACDVKNAILMAGGKEMSVDHFESTQSLLRVEALLVKNQLASLSVTLLKKEMQLEQAVLGSLIGWASLLRLKPALLNYLQEQLNYSIDITRLMIRFLCAPKRAIVLELALPILHLRLGKGNVSADLGRLVGRSQVGSTCFILQLADPASLSSNGISLVQILPGCNLRMQDQTHKMQHEEILISLNGLEVPHPEALIKTAFEVREGELAKQLDALAITDHSTDQLLQGEFYLNKLRGKLKAKIRQSELVFFAEGVEGEQRISLTRTRVYRLVAEERYFIVFKEQVEKEVNIVEASSEKAMKTLFLKLKDYIQEISTAFQWEKYYRQLYQQDISTLEEIQDVHLTNKPLMALSVSCALLHLSLAPDANLALRNLHTAITYNEFNTEAALGVEGIQLGINGERVISEMSLEGKYQSLQSRVVMLQVSRLAYQVRLCSTFSRMIAIAAHYQLLALSLRSHHAPPPPALQEDEHRLPNIKSQHSRSDNINRFLLEWKCNVSVAEVDGDILQYRNRLGSLQLETWKNRNQPHPSLSAHFKRILLFSMVQLPDLTLTLTPTQLTLALDSLNAQIDLQTIIYEVVRGEGSLVLKEVIRTIRDNEIARAQRHREQGRDSGDGKTIDKGEAGRKALEGKIGEVRVEVKVTSDLSLGISMHGLEVINGRFSWGDTLLWLNGECISLVENNGIVKWGALGVDLCMTNLKLKLNSKDILFLVYQLNKIKKFLRSNKFDAVAFVRQEYTQPDPHGRVAPSTHLLFSLRVQQVEVVYQCGDRTPLLSVRLKPVFLTTEGEANSVNISVWHLNRQLKLYQPVVEPLQMRVMHRRHTRQIELSLDEAYLILSQECLIDTLAELRLLQQMQARLDADESVELEEMGVDEVRRTKEELGERAFEWYVAPNFQQALEHSLMLRVANRLSCAVILEVSCGKKQKQRLVFQAEDETKAIFVPQRTSYQHSHELIERYQKVQLKLCLMNEFYSARPLSASFLLYDDDNHYIREINFMDANGVELESRVAVRVSYLEGGYQVELIGKYAIYSCLSLPLHFRYADACSINKRTLTPQQPLLLPPWLTDYLTFGLTLHDYDHVLRLCPEGQETEGWHVLGVPYGSGSKVDLVIHKTAIRQVANHPPKLKYLRHTHSRHQEEKQEEQKQDEEEQKQKEMEKEKQQNKKLCIYNYKILAGVLLINHLNFPITVNGVIFQTREQKQLLQVLLDNGKEYLRVSLGDRSTHQIYLPAPNQPTPVSLHLSEDNFVSLSVQVRRNRLQQRVVHLYAEVHLVVHVASLHSPTLVTNIYQHKFIVKKQVRNGNGDRPHPPPILKDKFCFSTAHYLLSLEERYMQLKLNGCTSNEFILFHSDFDADLALTSDLSGEVESVMAVSYSCEAVLLETDEEGRKPQLLECYTTYIMPKYYIINRSEESFVVNGSLLIRPGEKITIPNIRFLDLNVRDQLQFRLVPSSIDKASYLLFVRGTEERPSSEHLIENLTELAEVDPSERISDVNSKFEALPILRAVSEVTEYSKATEQGKDKKVGSDSITIEEKAGEYAESQGEDVSLAKGARHVVSMDDLQIFAVCRRACGFNTVSFEVTGWNQWLSVFNRLQHTLVVRVILQEGMVGVQHVSPGSTARIIAGISELVEVGVQLEGGEMLLGQFQLAQRLNHSVFLEGCGYYEVALRETKVRVGRMVAVEAVKAGQESSIHKVEQSLQVSIGKVRVSLVFSEERVRRELVRVSLGGVRLLGMRYRNGLYMLHLQLDSLNAIYKRASFLLLQAVSAYLEGVEGEFIERINLDLGPLVEITLSDEFIVSVISQVEALEEVMPGGKREQESRQEEQTYHVNSLGVRPIEIKLCMRKRISEMTEQKSRLLSKVGLSIVQVQDALIHLSPVEIITPLRQKHLNGISKMYTMQSFVGIASGLNILGNPAQFASEFQAGRNRGGVVPFFRSIVAGTSNSVSKIIGTIGSGVSELTFDREFMKHRIDNKNIKAESFGMGLKIGLRELAHSLKSGLAGVVQQPIQGHREQGGMGAVKGVLAGLTGLLTKPLTGLIFAASKTIEGVNSSVTYLDYRRLEREQLITRPLYHKFKLVRPYRAEDELAYNILLNWWQYGEVELVAAYLLEDQEGDSVADILIVTCSELILIDLDSKEVRLKLRNDQLLATGKFTEGVVLYYQDGLTEEDQDQIVFRLQKDPIGRENLYWTLKNFIGLYAQKDQ